MTENMLLMLGGGGGGGGVASSRRFFLAPKKAVRIEIDGWDSFSSLPAWRAVFIFVMSWMLTGAVSLETVLLSIQDKC